MDCPACGAPAVAFAVPPDLREHLPGDDPGAALCTRCLALHPVEDPPDDPPDFSRVSDAFPGNEDAALPMALLVGLVDSLAQYRAEIGELLGRVERSGTDPFLTLDRLADDPEVDAAADLRGRRRQLEQLI
ncbi:MAG: DUF6276 family protein [Haloarculaceae archaeon]